MLTLATVGFAINFWAWALLSPLAPKFQEALYLSPFQQSLVVAVPVVVGSLGRIPVGALTDRYGGRVMFPLVSLATVVPVLYLGLAGQTSLAGLLAGGFFLGIGGTAFAIGVPFVNAWFPPARRGLAVGVFGAGMGGTAISALTTVKTDRRGRHRDPRSWSPPLCSPRTRWWRPCCCGTRRAGRCRPSRWRNGWRPRCGCG
ncbi:MFS transporter [Microbispora sp. GKU 823]|uniref:MFS transporter n=1 Tax=Microbispora sp. GKU 823 TaxID=1652100 RepID=UPI002689E0B4|nr:MFS transporter [Microbispora sp. GKU 823]